MTLTADDRLWRDQNFPNMSDEDFQKIKHTFGGSGNGNGNGKDKNQRKRTIPINKYTGNGRLPLNESAIIGLVPKFVSLDESKKPIFKDVIEDLFIPGCNINTQNPLPLIFNSELELSEYLKLADNENLDSLFIKVETEFRKYVNVEEHYYPLLVADTIWTWFQDKFGYTHYLIIVGDNGSGKNSGLLLFKYLGYRVFYVVSASAANYYTKMGNNEEGQITIAEDEAEDIAFDRDKRNVWKTGYASGASVPKVELEGGRKSEDWLTYSQKWAAMEELPEDKNMKGILDRSIVLRFIAGDVPYNIKDVIRTGGDPKFTPLYSQLIHLRKLLFCYRLLHYDDIILDVGLNVKNRTQELTKSLIRLFRNSSVALEKIINSLSIFMVERNEVKQDSFESKLHEVIVALIKERAESTEELPEDSVLTDLEFTNASIKKKCVEIMEAEEIPDKPGRFYSLVVGSFSQSKISRVAKSKFKAKTRSVLIEGKTHRCMKFEQKYLDRIKANYTQEARIKIV